MISINYLLDLFFVIIGGIFSLIGGTVALFLVSEKPILILILILIFFVVRHKFRKLKFLIDEWF